MSRRRAGLLSGRRADRKGSFSIVQDGQVVFKAKLCADISIVNATYFVRYPRASA